MDKHRFFSAYNMVLMSMSAAIITICSWISLNIGSVPFTLQTLAIFAILMIIGGKRGIGAIVVYLLLGLIGIPVFAGFKGGADSLIGATGGFLVGFIAVGLLYWVIADIILARWTRKNNITSTIMKLAVCVICLAVLYAFGTVWFVNVYVGDSGKMSYAATLSICVTPFIIPDLAKIAVASVVANRTQKYVKK